ncbi:hypothetical protein WOLCODRAFT_153195 [Wolfiporia cocos MD-104 SS10]|uniref:Uncharacterized protein n=1 Tax=Wolfiporia cocos (strain MD-104) TaxID=742152 RepID=A0A2H3JNR1_WOLCO|nr:hypothetical protein WOLCODRAFT_153195 [Wolfiporia cocos MD-104 SS10]
MLPSTSRPTPTSISATLAFDLLHNAAQSIIHAHSTYPSDYALPLWRTHIGAVIAAITTGADELAASTHSDPTILTRVRNDLRAVSDHLDHLLLPSIPPTLAQPMHLPMRSRLPHSISHPPHITAPQRPHVSLASIPATPSHTPRTMPAPLPVEELSPPETPKPRTTKTPSSEPPPPPPSAPSPTHPPSTTPNPTPTPLPSPSSSQPCATPSLQSKPHEWITVQKSCNSDRATHPKTFISPIHMIFNFVPCRPHPDAPVYSNSQLISEFLSMYDAYIQSYNWPPIQLVDPPRWLNANLPQSKLKSSVIFSFLDPSGTLSTEFLTTPFCLFDQDVTAKLFTPTLR